MNLLDRYLQETGRYLPRRKRNDILAELQSAVGDALEDRFGPQPSEEQVAEVLQEFGSPRQVAGSYHPQSQYLVGPGLTSLFRMVAWIVIAAVVGSQALAWGVSLFIAEGELSILEMLASLTNSIPLALGWVLIVFIILQRLDVQPDLDAEEWDPADLPPLESGQQIKAGEQIAGLVFGLIILVIVFFFPEWIGFITSPGGRFYPNPVIVEYLTWIKISLAAGAALNLYLLWKRHWNPGSRIFHFLLQIVSVVVLALLVDGHNQWLAARMAGGFLEVVEAIPQMADGGWELIGMHAFRLGFLVALIVTVIEILATGFRFIRSRLRFSPSDLEPGTA